MKKITVSFENPKIEINGRVFELRRSYEDIIADRNAVLRLCAAMDTGNAEDVRNTIKMICETIDGILGAGAMLLLADGKPVSIGAAMKIMSGIVETAREAYNGYISSEYLKVIK